MAGENSFTDQIQNAIKGMSNVQKAVSLSIAVTVLLVLIGFGVAASQDRMEVLFSNLPAVDANRIVEDLRKQNVKFELSQDQRTITVPEARVGELRLKFAGDGLPKGEGIGFEKLEAPSLTTTDFTQRVIHRRALESHLAKTLRDGLPSLVADATVTITPANDSPFVTEKEDAKASVLLRLKGSRPLPEDNTQAIVNLVAASVEGLKPDHVVVVDQNSRILSRNGRDPLVGISDAQKKLAREEEAQLERRVAELLEPIVGLGRVRTTARVDLDFDKVKVNEEKYDPDGRVERSVQQKEEKISKRDAGGGAPGTPSNVPPATGGGGTPGSVETQDRKESTTNYEITKTVSATERAVGNVKRLSLAVVVDHASTWEKDPKGEAVEKLTPRTPDELKKIRDQVAAAVGFQPNRGDQLTVENMAFAPLSNPKVEAEIKRAFWMDLLAKAAPYVLWGIFGAIVFFMIVMPMLKKISAAINKPVPLRVAGAGGEGGEGGGAVSRKPTQVKSMAELNAEIEAELNAEGASTAPEVQRRSAIKRRLQEMTVSDPETAAQLVRSWMLEDGGRKA